MFQQAFGTAEVANFTTAQRVEYEQSRINYLGVKAVSDTAKEAGRKERDVEIAKKLRKMGLSIEAIIEATGLVKDEVENL